MTAPQTPERVGDLDPRPPSRVMAADDPRHGTDAGASAHHRAGGEPCEPCRLADAIAGRRRRKRREQGYVFRLELGDRNHQRLTVLRERGLTYQQIADCAGVSYRTAWSAVNGGPDSRVTTATFNAFTRMRPLGQVVTSTGLSRRLQALIWLGYSLNRLSRETGISPQWLRHIRDNDINGPQSTTAKAAIVEVFDRLHMTHPLAETTGQKKSVSRARSYARINGYMSPLAWDDDTIDDRTARPYWTSDRRTKHDLDPVVVERILAGDRLVTATKAERFEVIRRWPGSLNELGRLRPAWNVARDLREMADDERVAS